MGRSRNDFSSNHREGIRERLRAKLSKPLNCTKTNTSDEFLTRMQTAATRSRGKVGKQSDMVSRQLVEADTDSATSVFFDKLIDEIYSDNIEDVNTSYCTSVGWEIYDTGECDAKGTEQTLAEDVQKVTSAVSAVKKVEASVEQFPFTNVSSFNDEKLSELKLLFSAYEECQTLQNCGFYQMAFHHYCKLMPFLTCDGLFWLRIAECCIYARFKANNVCLGSRGVPEYDIKDDDVSFMSLFLNNSIPCKKVQHELDEEGMTLDYAEVALNNSIMLLDDDRNKFLKDHATTLASFISMKSNRFRDSLLLLRKFDHTTDPRLILRALLIEAEIDLHEMNKETDEKLLNFELLSRTVCSQKDSEQSWYPLLIGHITKQEGCSTERVFEVYKKFAKPRSSDLILGAVMCRKANMMKQFNIFLADLLK